MESIKQMHHKEFIKLLKIYSDSIKKNPYEKPRYYVTKSSAPYREKALNNKFIDGKIELIHRTIQIEDPLSDQKPTPCTPYPLIKTTKKKRRGRKKS